MNQIILWNFGSNELLKNTFELTTFSSPHLYTLQRNEKICRAAPNSYFNHFDSSSAICASARLFKDRKLLLAATGPTVAKLWPEATCTLLRFSVRRNYINSNQVIKLVYFTQFLIVLEPF